MKTNRKLLLIVALLPVLFVVLTSLRFQKSGGSKFVAPASANELKNPLKDNASATAEGKKIYDNNCAICHGAKGKGDGVAAAGLNKAPADHTSAVVQEQSDGALFWKISEGSNPMPAYKAVYSETQRWQLVNYIRTLAKSKK